MLVDVVRSRRYARRGEPASAASRPAVRPQAPVGSVSAATRHLPPKPRSAEDAPGASAPAVRREAYPGDELLAVIGVGADGAADVGAPVQPPVSRPGRPEAV
jgi:hypothetical protein